MFGQSLRRVLTALLLASASSAWAYVIDGSGRIVDSLGREWLQNQALITGGVNNFTWAQFDAVCFHEGEGGIRTPCTGPAGSGGFDLTGWTWAFASEVGALFQEVATQNGCLGCTSAAFVDQVGAGWADQSIADLGATAVFAGFLLESQGWAATPAQDPNVGDMPYMRLNTVPNKLIESLYDPNNPSPDGASFNVGGWFFRSASIVVPEPTTLALLVASLAALIGLRSRHRK